MLQLEKAFSVPHQKMNFTTFFKEIFKNIYLLIFMYTCRYVRMYAYVSLCAPHVHSEDHTG